MMVRRLWTVASRHTGPKSPSQPYWKSTETRFLPNVKVDRFGPLGCAFLTDVGVVQGQQLSVTTRLVIFDILCHGIS
jgi:hypothetical protein